MIRVTNGRVTGFIGENKVYIGRFSTKYGGLQESVLANPYHISQLSTREKVVAKYRVWLWKMYQKKGAVYEELHRLAKLPELELVCWCSPKSCHGDVVKNCLEWIQSQTQ